MMLYILFYLKLFNILFQDSYLEMRQKAQKFLDAPITTRQLESMIRLAECRARVELRDEVTESDAQDVIDLMSGTLVDVFANKTSDLIQVRPSLASGKGKQGNAKRMIQILQRIACENGNNILKLADLKRAAENIGYVYV